MLDMKAEYTWFFISFILLILGVVAWFAWQSVIVSSLFAVFIAISLRIAYFKATLRKPLKSATHSI